MIMGEHISTILCAFFVLVHAIMVAWFNYKQKTRKNLEYGGKTRNSLTHRAQLWVFQKRTQCPLHVISTPIVAVMNSN